MNWINIWEEGLRKSKENKLRDQNNYVIIDNNHPSRELGDTDIYNEKWVKILKEALMSQSPSHAFEYWKEQGWLRHAIPEIDSYWGRIQNEIYHPEIDVGIHAMMVIDRASFHNLSLDARLACLLHDLGKSLTELGNPSHIMHEKNGVPLAENYLTHWNVEKRTIDIVLNVVEYHGTIHLIEKMNPDKIYKLIKNINALENQGSINSDILKSIACDDQGRKGFFDTTPRGVILLANIINSLKKNKNKMTERAKIQTEKNEIKSVSKGAEPYSIEKRERLIKDNFYLEILKDIKEIKEKYLGEQENVDKRVKYKKNSFHI